MREKLTLGKIYRTDLYRDKPCIYMGSKISRGKLRHLIVFDEETTLLPLTFDNYELKEDTICLSGRDSLNIERTPRTNLGFPLLNRAETIYVYNLLRQKVPRA